MSHLIFHYLCSRLFRTNIIKQNENNKNFAQCELDDAHNAVS